VSGADVVSVPSESASESKHRAQRPRGASVGIFVPHSEQARAAIYRGDYKRLERATASK